MHYSGLIITTLPLLFGLSLGVNEKFDIKEVNTLEAPKYEKAMLNPDGSYPFLLDTLMWMPQDIDQLYYIRTTVVPNAHEDSKVLSVVYDSDYDGYEDIGVFVVEEGASEAFASSKSLTNGKWRIRFLPEAQEDHPYHISIGFNLEDPKGRRYIGRDTLSCEGTPDYGGFRCVKQLIPLSSTVTES